MDVTSILFNYPATEIYTVHAYTDIEELWKSCTIVGLHPMKGVSIVSTCFTLVLLFISNLKAVWASNNE